MLEKLNQIGSLLTDLSFFGSFCIALYGLRKPKTRQHIQMALARLARPERGSEEA